MSASSPPPSGAPAAPRPSGTTVAEVHRRRDTCRACGSRRLELVLALGPQPLANAFLASEEEFAGEARYPLDLVVCADCALVQIVDVIDPKVLFAHYLYVTGTSETIALHNRRYAERVRSLLGLESRDLVVEIASNDGSLLGCFRDLGVRTLGVEPATNIAEVARAHGLETVNAFFDAELAADLRQSAGPARAVLANNVLAHVDDPGDFLRGCGTLIADDGLVVVEVPYAGEMLARLEYDTIYHEHLSYFAVAPLSRLASDAGLCVKRVEHVPVHGGSIRVYFGKGSEDAPSVREELASEVERSLASVTAWQQFGRDAHRHAATTRALLERLAGAGKRLAAYGAPAKGNTLLNYCQIGTALLPFTVDRNPLKVGRFTPGMHLPVRPVEALDAERPDHVMVLAWNFAEEIMRQQAAHAARGGRWLVPIPEPRII